MREFSKYIYPWVQKCWYPYSSKNTIVSLPTLLHPNVFKHQAAEAAARSTVWVIRSAASNSHQNHGVENCSVEVPFPKVIISLQLG